MRFDSQLLFWHTGTAFAFTQGEFVSMITATNLASTAINILNAADLGIGDGEAMPKIAAYIGTAVTSASTALRLNFQFQGSTDSSNWTTYAETGPMATTTLIAGAKVIPFFIEHRPPGVSLPQYYRLNATVSATNGSDTISSGTILAGIVLSRDDNPVGLYSSNFTVV